MTTATTARVEAVLAELEALEDPRTRAVNQAHGDDHGVKLAALRVVAKRLKTDHELSRQLWATDVTAAKLLALLICRPREFTAEELDRMIRSADTPKLADWLVNYVVVKSQHTEELRLRWFTDEHPDVAAAAWALTAKRVAKDAQDLDLAGLLDIIESEMAAAPDRLQWSMNACLAEIGINHDQQRDRAIAIGKRLEVLKDYPTSPGCTSPYAPIWISEMVRRHSQSS